VPRRRDVGAKSPSEEITPKLTPPAAFFYSASLSHPFGSSKQWMNQGAFLMKGLDNVRAEFNLTARASEGLGRGGRS
jgi:hypothetical protein